MMDVEVRVGTNLRFQGPDGVVRTYTVTMLTASGGGGPTWTSNTPISGLVRLRLEEKTDGLG